MKNTSDNRNYACEIINDLINLLPQNEKHKNEKHRNENITLIDSFENSYNLLEARIGKLTYY